MDSFRIAELRLIVQPDSDEPGAAEVLVSGSIAGVEYLFLLDTGAARSCVLPDEYTATFSPAGDTSSWGAFGPGSNDLITVPSLALGSIVRKDFTLARVRESHPGMRSLVAMDLLKDYCCRFLFSENRLLLSATCEPGEGHAPELALLDLLLDKVYHPYVSVWFGEARANAVWDSGAGVTVADTGFIQRHPGFFREAGSSEATDSTGRKVQTPMFIMGPVVIGGREFPPHRVAGVDLSGPNATIEVPMDLILGYSTLSNADWLFDFPGKRWAILTEKVLFRQFGEQLGLT